MHDEGLKSAYKEADRHLWTKKDLEAYDYERMRETDEITREMFVEQKAKIDIAKKLIKRNLSNEEIAEDTGLTAEQIEQLRS
jgi:predicted XRE-type DNA-binding protein